MFEDNKSDSIGKLFFIVSILALIYLYMHVDFSRLAYTFIHIDEYFTLAFIRFPVENLITATAHDVHPPLYYLMLKVLTKFLSIFSLTKFSIVFLRLFSLVPYLIILLFSATKIRKEYGWLAAGILTFALLAMTTFSIFYFLIRMYSWAILFVLLAFYCVKKILENNDKKYWCLLTVFTVLASYTHYFAALTLVVLYLLILGYFLINRKLDYIKLWFISVIAGVICYLPWCFSLFKQLNKVHQQYWIPQLTSKDFLDCLSFFAVSQDCNFCFKIISVVLLISVILLVYKKYRNDKSIEDTYCLIGVFTFIGTILLGVIISISFKPILIVRYLIFAATIFWFAVSIYIGTLEDKKILGIFLIAILLFGGIGIMNMNSYDHEFEVGVKNEKLLEDLNNQDNVTIICVNRVPTILFGTYLNNCDIYSTVDSPYGLSLDKFDEINHVNYIPEKDIGDFVKDNDNKTIYIIKSKNIKLDDDLKLEKYGHVYRNYVYKVSA